MSRSFASERDRRFFIGTARAFGGAVFFSLPLMMTMEMWWLGFYMDRGRLALFMALMIPFLIALDHYSGFKETTRWSEDVLDGFVGYGVGLAASAAILLLLNAIGTSQPLDEVVGKVCLQAVPAAFGAVLASSQFAGGGDADGENVERDRQERAGYGAQIFFMGVGAVFLSFNIAPTEEVVLIAAMVTPWHGVALALVSIALMHAFVYAVRFRGAPAVHEGTPGWSVFLRFTVVGYALALVICAYVLWTFGRFGDTALDACVLQTIVLAFPASLGGAAARLIL